MTDVVLVVRVEFTRFMCTALRYHETFRKQGEASGKTKRKSTVT